MALLPKGLTSGGWHELRTNPCVEFLGPGGITTKSAAQKTVTELSWRAAKFVIQ